MKVGVLGFQGSVEEHIFCLEKLNIEAVKVKDSVTLAKVNGIILPGGESTTHIKLLKENGLFDALKEAILEGMPTLATCAGLILLANKVDTGQDSLKVLDIEVVRNGYGSQLFSFVEDINILGFSEPFRAVFIRAPIIKSIGKDINILAKDSKGNICFVKCNKILGLTFHPELTSDLRVHKMFIDLI